MLCRMALAMAVVCVGGICSRVQVDPVSRLTVPRDPGVRLCGREFIRAVIFTCGGSRWRRSTEGDSVPFQWSPLTDVPLEDDQHSRQPGRELTEGPSARHVASSHSLEDLRALYVQQRPPSDPAPLPSTVWGERDGIQSKRRRNFSLGVAGKCCDHGCSKNDIGRLC